MRQRYLLGAHNRKRYVEDFALLSSEYDPREVYMQSTNVNRTMQSGYSELMGLYPPGKGDRLTPAMTDVLASTSAPPFNVRDAAQISAQLGSYALPNGFVQVAISEFNNRDIHDDVSTDGCSYINRVGSAREVDNQIWDKYDWMQT